MSISNPRPFPDIVQAEHNVEAGAKNVLAYGKYGTAYLPIKLNSDGSLGFVPYTGATADVDLGIYDVESTEVRCAKLYLGDNGVKSNFNSWIQERPSATNKRVIIYGAPYDTTFGYIVSPTGTTSCDVNMNLWSSDLDGGGTTNYAGFTLLGKTTGDLRIFNSTKDIIFAPASTNTATVKTTGFYCTNNYVTNLYDSSGLTNLYLDPYNITFSVFSQSFGYMYYDAIYGSGVYFGNGMIDIDFAVYGLYKTSLMYDCGADLFTFYSASLFSANMQLAAEKGFYITGAAAETSFINLGLLQSGNDGLFQVVVEATNYKQLQYGSGAFNILGDYDMKGWQNRILKGTLISTGNTNTWRLEADTGDFYQLLDNGKHYFGAGVDCSIYYDGTDMIINPKVVGSGDLKILGVIYPTGYKSSDGSAGQTVTITTAALTAGGTQGSQTFKNGILTAQTQAT